jgi:hypothetical protein
MGAFIDEARSFLTTAGYESSLLCPDYQFTWREPQGNLINSPLPLVAFSGSPLTLRTACVSVLTANSDSDCNEQLKKLRFLASPVAIVKTGGIVGLWAVRRDGEPEKLAAAESENWRAAFQPRMQELSPATILSSKIGPRQLSFVDSGLVEWAERITEQTLTTLIEDVLHAAIGSRGSASSPRARQAVLRLVFQLFACRVLEDKNVITKKGTAKEALQAANERFSDNIDPNVVASPSLNASLVAAVFTQLRTRFAFSSLTTEMLGHVYENALVTPEFRQEHGIYYTPRVVTSYILNRLPIESIPEDKRFLMDPCCGSGSFLLAGFDRLLALLGTGWTSSDQHQYLRTRLVGMDTDEFAIETAILSLVVRDPLNRNGWKISRQDVQELKPSSSQRPAIMVTNPPFKELKSGGIRREFAAEVLIKAIDAIAPGGLMGIVLPQSVLDSRTASDARSEAVRRCDILEILTLPGGLFYSNADTAVLMMRKKTGRPTESIARALTVRELHAQDLPRFRSAAGFTVTYSVGTDKLANDSEHRFILSPFGPLWERLENTSHTLKEFTTIRSGLQVKKTDKHSVSASPRKGDVKYVNRLDILRPYALLLGVGKHRPMWIKYGPQLRRSADQDLFEKEKVLLSSNRNPGSPWRLVAAPAPRGLYFSDNFHGLIPKSGGLPIHVISAILNSPLANAWFHAHCRKRKIVHGTLGELPVPKLDDISIKEIENLAKRVEDAVISSARLADEGLFYEGSSDGTAITSLVTQLDQLIYNAYNLSAIERRDIDLFMTNARRPS